MGNITISEIAKEAGVSKSTVSRVLNHKPDVLPETKKRILEIVAKYHFQPSIHAVSMSQKRCNCIGLVIPHDIDYVFKNQYYSEIQRTILKAAQVRGYYVLLLCCRDMKEAVDAVMQRRVDGLIVLSPIPEHKQALETFETIGIPFVTIGKCQFVENAYQLCTDNYLGGMLAMQHLLKLGHQRIVFINGPKFLPSSKERLRAYRDAMQEAGLSVQEDMIAEGRNSIESGYAAATALMQCHPETTAFFVASDFMAIGVENALRELGKIVPKDVSVIGFDNIPLAGQLTPALTTIDQHIEEKGSLSVKMLVDLLKKKRKPKKTSVDIEPTLCIRNSTAKVK